MVREEEMKEIMKKEILPLKYHYKSPSKRR